MQPFKKICGLRCTFHLKKVFFILRQTILSKNLNKALNINLKLVHQYSLSYLSFDFYIVFRNTIILSKCKQKKTSFSMKCDLQQSGLITSCRTKLQERFSFVSTHLSPTFLRRILSYKLSNKVKQTKHTWLIDLSIENLYMTRMLLNLKIFIWT